LLTRASNCPRCQCVRSVSATCVTKASNLALSPTSSCSAAARRPSASIAATTAAASSRPLRYVTITSVPCAASFRAMSRPRPRLPPVTRAMGVGVFMAFSFRMESDERHSIDRNPCDKSSKYDLNVRFLRTIIRNMNQLDVMRTFIRVAELSSFSRAADSLGLPKASASTAVRKLETLLGTQLLHRTTRRVHLTADGQAFYERCKDLLDDVEELQSMFQRGPQTLRGRLRVDMSSGLARHFVLPRLPGFLDQHPLLEIELSNTDRRVDVVREGFDCVLRVGAVEDSTLVARGLGALPVVN